MAAAATRETPRHDTLGPVRDRVERHEFPPAGRAEIAPVAAVDTERFAQILAAEVAAVAELAVSGTAAPATGASAAVFVRSDGARAAISIPLTLAAALVNHRCGGSFAQTTPNPAGASVARVIDELQRASLRAVDHAWPGSGGWQAAIDNMGTTQFGITLTIEGRGFDLAFAVVPAAGVSAGDGGWSLDLRAALDATDFAVRAVLHEHPLPLVAALAFAVGDVVPIETRRDVSLRVGDRILARGTITPAPDGGYRVTVSGGAATGVTPAPEEPR